MGNYSTFQKLYLFKKLNLELVPLFVDPITFKHIKANNSYEEAFCQLGQSWDISTELFQKLPEITSHIYVPSTNVTSVNDLQYQMFCAG